MLQIEYKLKFGQDEFTLKAEVKDEKEFFETMSFYSNLPRTAPGGADDLKLVFRTTPQGHKYYSLVSEVEKMEFKLGQNKENQGGGLFPKGWAPLWEREQSDANEASQGSFPQASLPKPPVSTIQPPKATFKAPVLPAAPMPQQVQPQPQVQAPTAVQNAVTPAVNNVMARFKRPQGTV